MSLHDDSSLCCEVALRLLDEYDRADRQWLDRVRVKIDAAVAMSENTPPIDGETFIAGRDFGAFPKIACRLGYYFPRKMEAISFLFFLDRIRFIRLLILII
jgi:hypothetical protein